MRTRIAMGMAMLTLSAMSASALGGVASGALTDFDAPSSAAAGSTITVSSVSSCFPNASVLVVLSATGGPSNPTLASAATTSNGSGGWSVQLTIPVALSPGVYDLQAFCEDPSSSTATAVEPPFRSGIAYDLIAIEITAAQVAPAAQEVVAQPTTSG